MDSENDEFREWLAVGIANGWVSEPFDIIEDGVPLNDGEEDSETLYLPCLRVYGPRYFGVLSA